MVTKAPNKIIILMIFSMLLQLFIGVAPINKPSTKTCLVTMELMPAVYENISTVKSVFVTLYLKK